MTLVERLRQRIFEPQRSDVSGYRDIICSNYRTHLTEQNIEDLIAELLTLWVLSILKRPRT